MNKIKIKNYILAFLLLELLLAYAPAYAQTVNNNITYDYAQCSSGTCQNPVSSQIEKYLCAPSQVITSQTSNTNGFGSSNVNGGFQANAAANNTNAGDLYKCINQLYKFAIVIASVLGVFFIVIAGYIYMSANGDSEGVTKAKNILETTITAIVILLAGYVLLKAINPDLIQFQPIQPPSVVANNAAGTVNGVPATVNGVPAGGVISGTAQQLAQQILNNSNVTLASLHSSGISDNANALQNIKDTAAGNPASRSNYQRRFRWDCCFKFQNACGVSKHRKSYKINVSEIAGGSHTDENANPNSTNGHYGGDAFDITSFAGTTLNSTATGGSAVQNLMTLCKNLGAGQVIDETASANHVHCGAF